MKPHPAPSTDPEDWDDQNDAPTFQPLHKQTNKPQTVKDMRKQQAKEWGRAINKQLRQRPKSGKP